MKSIIFILTLLIYSQSLSSQAIEASYLQKNHQKVDLNTPSFHLFDEEFYQHDLFFFGFIHGSATPQILDYELLVHLYEKGVRYYAPEIGYSYAYFLNHYLQTGDESYLNYVLEDEIRYIVPQDASIEWKEKWKKIYAFNKAKNEEDKIKIIGTDHEDLNLTFLAHLAPNEQTGIILIDSLHFFKKLPKHLDIIPLIGKKIYRPIIRANLYQDYYEDSFRKRFYEAYTKDKKTFLKPFGINEKEVEMIMDVNEAIKDKYRENAIFLNFKKLVFPLIEQGEKVYSNFGYTHVLQEKIDGYPYIANRVKEGFGDKIKLISILGIMANSEVMKYRTYKSKGYRISKFWDGDSILERVKGIKMLKRIAKGNDVTLFKLNGKNSPFNKSLYFVNYTRNRESIFRKGRFETERGSSTTDYIQYLLFIQNSKSNRPFP